MSSLPTHCIGCGKAMRKRVQCPHCSDAFCSDACCRRHAKAFHASARRQGSSGCSSVIGCIGLLALLAAVGAGVFYLKQQKAAAPGEQARMDAGPAANPQPGPAANPAQPGTTPPVAPPGATPPAPILEPPTEQDVLAALNEVRKAAGKPALQAQRSARKAAQEQAQKMALTGKVGPGNSSALRRLLGAGYHVNQAEWFLQRTDKPETAEQLVQAWLEDRGKKEVESSAYLHAGYGAARGPDGALYLVILLARPGG